MYEYFTSLDIQYDDDVNSQNPQLKTFECHSNWGGGNGLTNQNPPLAISVPYPSLPPLTYH
jgi:hypothetical protein